METSDQKTKEQLCKEMLEKIFLEAENEAAELLIEYPETVNIEFDCSVDDKVTVATRLLYGENEKYDKITNIRNIEKAKIYYLNHFVRTNEIYDKEMNFNSDGYNAQKRRIMEQILVVKKVEYLNNIIEEYQDSNETNNNEKIDWLGQPSQLAYLILQLIEKKYIESPGNRQQDRKSQRKIARLIYDCFSIKDLKGEKETTFDNFYKEFYSNSLTSAAQERFRIKENI